MGSSPTFRISPVIIRSLNLVIAKTKYIFQDVRAFCEVYVHIEVGLCVEAHSSSG